MDSFVVAADRALASRDARDVSAALALWPAVPEPRGPAADRARDRMVRLLDLAADQALPERAVTLVARAVEIDPTDPSHYDWLTRLITELRLATDCRNDPA